MIGAGVGLIVVVMVVVVIWARRYTEHDCGDLGAVASADGSSPREALASYLAQVGGDPSQWSAGGYGDNSYRRTSDDAVPTVHALVVGEVTPGRWSVIGSCV